MTLKLEGALALSLALTLACAGGKDDDNDDVTDESGGGGQDDTSASSDDSDNGDTSFGEVFDRTDPLFSASFRDSTWTSAEGHYFGNRNGSTITASDSDESYSRSFTINVDGNIRYAGTYPVTQISYTEAPAQGSPDLNFTASNPAGVTITVLGFAEETYLFAELDGSATLTDSIGGAGTTTFSGLVLESWPKF
ncbi:MAG: hypothetical protein H6740_25430 [Alphaproteobacteria bacterium]|nr:hypothetical protein [Alphaproteobacteria bacterium]